MNGMNKVVLIGHLGADPKAGSTPTGKRVTSFNIATNEYFKDKSGEKTKRTDWHKITAWGKTAEACEKMLRKGSMVLVEGKIRTSTSEKDDKKQKHYEIYATDVSFISNYGDGQAENDDKAA
ncbi:MAG: single-stranded DNA-binding protein [Pseudomonadota bacterium]